MKDPYIQRLKGHKRKPWISSLKIQMQMNQQDKNAIKKGQRTKPLPEIKLRDKKCNFAHFLPTKFNLAIRNIQNIN